MKTTVILAMSLFIINSLFTQAHGELLYGPTTNPKELIRQLKTDITQKEWNDQIVRNEDNWETKKHLRDVEFKKDARRIELMNDEYEDREPVYTWDTRLYKETTILKIGSQYWVYDNEREAKQKQAEETKSSCWWCIG